MQRLQVRVLGGRGGRPESYEDKDEPLRRREITKLGRPKGLPYHRLHSRLEQAAAVVSPSRDVQLARRISGPSAGNRFGFGVRGRRAFVAGGGGSRGQRLGS